MTEVVPSVDAAREFLVQLWRELLGAPALLPEDNFFGSGGTSIYMKATLEALHQKYGVRLELEALVDYPTASQLAMRVAHRETLTI